MILTPVELVSNSKLEQILEIIAEVDVPLGFFHHDRVTQPVLCMNVLNEHHSLNMLILLVNGELND